MKNNVLILNPYSCRDYYSDITVQWKKRSNLLHPPIFLGYIAAYLRHNGVGVTFLDAAGESLSFSENLKKITEIRPDLIITKTHFSTWHKEKELFAQVKERVDAAIISVGIHPTLTPVELLSSSPVDVAVRNEPELSCLDIASGISLSNIDGISYKDGARIINNTDRELIEDLDTLPLPARDLFPHKNYRLSSYRKRPMTVVYSGRGCYFHCIHCGQQKMWGNRRRVRSAGNVIREIEEIYRQGYREISFEDQSVECDDRMIEIAAALKKYKFSWKFGTRADFINEKALEIFKESGCYEVFLGVESASQESLDWLNKGISLKQIEEAFSICRKNKLCINATFMIGLPQDNTESIEKTIALAKRLNPDYATFYAFTPLAGTQAFDFYNANQLLGRKDWDAVDFQQVGIKTRYLSSRQIECLINRAYSQFYFRAGYILGRFKKINSFSLFGALTSAVKLIVSLFVMPQVAAGFSLRRLSQPKGCGYKFSSFIDRLTLFNLAPNNKAKKERILQSAKSEYKRFEAVKDKKSALRKAIEYRRRGFYFAVPVKEVDGWRVYFE